MELNENNPSAEEVETVETDTEHVHTSLANEVVEDEPLLTIDDLLGITEDDDVLFTEGDSSHTGMRPLHELLKHLPEDARKHLANMRSNYTQKTQSLADERRTIEKLKAELISTKEAGLNSKILDETAQYITDEKHDIYSDEGMKAEIKKQAALMLKEMMAPAQEKLALEKNQHRVESFKAEHPEMMTEEYRMPIAKMLMSRPELSLEDAYYIVSAKISTEQNRNQIAENKNRKTTRKSVISKTSTGSNAQPKGAPKFKNAWEAYVFHRDNQ